MYVTFTANSFGVAQSLGDRFDCLHNVALDLSLGGFVQALEFFESTSSQYCAVPGSKIFGGELLAGDLLDTRSHRLSR